jgi:hypothetical protein
LKAYVNRQPVELVPGMTVKHALIAAGLLKELDSGKKVYDDWGHELGLDGAVTAGMKIFVK